MNRRDAFKAMLGIPLAGAGLVELDDDPKVVYALQCQQKLSRDHMERIYKMWTHLWSGPGPRLLIVDQGMELKKL